MAGVEIRLDNNRGFFSPEQKSCRIPISLANKFCITEVPCHKNGQGTKAQPGEREREDSSPGLACAAFPGSCDQTPASISHPCFKGCWQFVDGAVPSRLWDAAAAAAPRDQALTFLQPGLCSWWKPRLEAGMLCPHPLLLPVSSASASA